MSDFNLEKWYDFLTEGENSVLELTFYYPKYYGKTKSALLNAGWRDSNSGNPPEYSGQPSFTPNDVWRTIRIFSNQDEALKILDDQGIIYYDEYKKPMDYVVFDKGGSYD